MISTNCPNCNTLSGKAGAYDFATPDGENLIRWHYITCRSCGFSTKSTLSEEAATEEWINGQTQ